jgi:hypothetical protein
MARWTAREIAAIPTVSDGEPGDPAWFPLQHALGIDTFGVNLFEATRGDETLVGEHDEHGSAQQELYLVLAGRVLFELDGERVETGARSAVAVTDPSVRRCARALEPGTSLLVVGAAEGRFVSTWHASHFESIPRP